MARWRTSTEQRSTPRRAAGAGGRLVPCTTAPVVRPRAVAATSFTRAEMQVPFTAGVKLVVASAGLAIGAEADADAVVSGRLPDTHSPLRLQVVGVALLD